MAMANPNRVYEDFEPPSDLVSEHGCDTVLVYLPGFRKEQLKVQLTPTRILKVSGERAIDDKKWRRFQKDFEVSTNCDIKEITARYEGGILYIRQPKIITPAPPEQQQIRPESDQKPTVDAHLPPPPQPAQPQPPQPLHPPEPEPEPQPPQPLPQPQPLSQPQAPQPLPQPEPEPEPQPLSQPQAPLPRIPEEEEDEIARRYQEGVSSKGKEDNKREDRGESSARQTQQVVAGSGLFKELKNPENLKRLAVSVLMVIIVGFYVLQLFKSLTRREQKTVIEYAKEL